MKPGLEAARTILAALLAERDPWLGSQLKLELRRRYELATGQEFREQTWGYAKFSAFLQANSDLVCVEWHDDAPSSDVHVSRVVPAAQTAPGGNAEVLMTAKRLPQALWQAFTNPDPKRRRFYDRSTERVVHYVEGSALLQDVAARAEVERGRDNLVEIDFIRGEEQKRWMREFLERVGGPQRETDILQSLLDSEYTSALNAFFTRGLGPRSSEWRAFRRDRVLQAAQKWAQRHSIGGTIIHHAEAEVEKPASGTSDLRAMLHAMINFADDRELATLMVPASLIPKLRRAQS